MCISGCQHQLLATTLLSVRFRASVTLVSTSTDGDLYMRTHVQRTVSSCFAALRQLRETRRLVPSATFQSLVIALVHSRLDHGSSMLVGIQRI